MPTDPTSNVPRARHTELVITRSGDTVLVYDLRSHRLHKLDVASHAVWQRCTGGHTLRTLTASFAAEANPECAPHNVAHACTVLDEAGLLEPGSWTPPASSGPLTRRSRRALLASAAALPVVVSITAPVAAGSLSNGTAMCHQECNRDTDCGGCCSACNYPERSTANAAVDPYTCFNPAYADFEAGNAYRC